MSRLTTLNLQGNPGAPFVLKSELEKQGDDSVVVKVAEAAPFGMEFILSAQNGSLSGSSVDIAAGSTTSAVITVTPNQSDARVTVSVDTVSFRGSPSFDGIQTNTGEPLDLIFGTPPPEPDPDPTPEPEPTTGICDRTEQVRDAILVKLPRLNGECSAVTAFDLRGVTGYMSVSGLTALEKDDLQGLTELSQLYLGHNSLSTLPDDIFDDLGNLIYLDLRNNDLSSVPADVFDELTNLDYLSLDSNSISSLPSGVFDKLTELGLPEFVLERHRHVKQGRIRQSHRS